MGCGCKKNQPAPPPATVQVVENQPQEPNAMEQQVEELVKKIEEINNQG